MRKVALNALGIAVFAVFGGHGCKSRDCTVHIANDSVRTRSREQNMSSRVRYADLLGAVVEARRHMPAEEQKALDKVIVDALALQCADIDHVSPGMHGLDLFVGPQITDVWCHEIETPSGRYRFDSGSETWDPYGNN